MPYKIEGTSVMQQKGGKWVVVKKHPTRAAAMAHLKALESNVDDAKGKPNPFAKKAPPFAKGKAPPFKKK